MAADVAVRSIANSRRVPLSLPHDHNRRAWDARARRSDWFTEPIEDAAFARPLESLDQAGWLEGDVTRRRVLCLAAGGGRQGPLFAAAGAITTVFDLSAAMLARDVEVAAARGLDLRVVQGSMDDLSAFEPASFDIVCQPVSTCYVPDVGIVFREIARVVAPGGIYISQHKQPTSLQSDVRPSPGGYLLREPYYRREPLPPVSGTVVREEGTIEFLHRWEQLLGGICRAGFVIEDVLEPLLADPHGDPAGFARRSAFIPPYVRIKARRRQRATPPTNAPPLWMPGA